MIQSMTGYAVGNRAIGAATIHIEFKSVNSRFLDLVFRHSEESRFLELPMRELIMAKIQRGKVECRINLLSRHGDSQRELTPNTTLIAQLGRLDLAVREALPAAAPLSVAEILRWPGVLGDEAIPQEQLQAEGMALAAAVLEEFTASRLREGAKLATVILDSVTTMRSLVERVAPILPQSLAEYEQRLAGRLREVLATLDEERIRQEIGVLATRIDVAEELARLSAHLDEVWRVVQKGGAVGKRLDFLMQELNREANTLASKSVSTEVTSIAIELKLRIEQMREQVQNLE